MGIKTRICATFVAMECWQQKTNANKKKEYFIQH